ncbi:MAG: phosphotyrosine protein phosphatase [Cycloclasticus sp.]|nr:MAG: phosphotyrosine protein phosphatase [Cycloclasticus sp.]
MRRIKILFICMGNICRSPTAHGVFRKLVNDKGYAHLISIDSAGTHAYHVGNSPDARSVSTAMEHGVDMTDLRSRQVHESDYEYFDYLLVMDAHNHALIEQACPSEHKSKIHYFLDFASHTALREVPDPYYGKGNGFERVFDMIEDASEGLLVTLIDRQ